MKLIDTIVLGYNKEIPDTVKDNQVKCFDTEFLKAELKKCSKEVQQYVASLERLNKNWKSITDEAIKKVKEQAKLLGVHPNDELP